MKYFIFFSQIVKIIVPLLLANAVLCNPIEWQAEAQNDPDVSV